MILTNCKVNWCCILKPNEKFTPRWEVEVELSKENLKKISLEYKKEQEQAEITSIKKLKIKKTDKGIDCIRIGRKTVNAKGEENKRPVLKGTQKIEGELEDLNCFVGNGSVCNVQYDFYVWDNEFGKGVQIDFKGIQVLDLVEYGVQDGDEFDEIENSSNEINEESKSEEDFDDDDFS